MKSLIINGKDHLSLQYNLGKGLFQLNELHGDKKRKRKKITNTAILVVLVFFAHVG